jgi:hypothetical protein
MWAVLPQDKLHVKIHLSGDNALSYREIMWDFIWVWFIITTDHEGLIGNTIHMYNNKYAIMWLIWPCNSCVTLKYILLNAPSRLCNSKHDLF